MWFALAALAAEPAPPAVARCGVLLPRYTVDGKPLAAGTAFPVKVGNRIVLVTAHDVFGPNGGLPAQLAPTDVIAKVQSATAFDAADAKTECGRATRALLVADAAPSGGGNDASRDVAVLEALVVTDVTRIENVGKAELAPLAFAGAAPKVGDAVWVAFPEGGAPVQAAKVVEVAPGFLFYEFGNRDLKLAGSVGAPVLDAAGAVVGMAVGLGKMADGALIGSAVPLDPLKQRVIAAASLP